MIDRKHIFAVENALAAQEAGASMVAMHGRTRKQMYQGHADWETLHDVAQALDIPFVANGDIKTPELAKKALNEIGSIVKIWLVLWKRSMAKMIKKN